VTEADLVRPSARPPPRVLVGPRHLERVLAFDDRAERAEARPLLDARDETVSHGLRMRVADHGDDVGVGEDRLHAVAPLEERALALAELVHPERDAALEVLHEGVEARAALDAEDHVPVVGHDADGVELDAVLLDRLRERLAADEDGLGVRAQEVLVIDAHERDVHDRVVRVEVATAGHVVAALIDGSRSGLRRSP